MLYVLNGIDATARLATSALPDAPTVEPVAARPGHARSAVAALLRRAADRVAREPLGLPAQ
jgi:hypothetical protein